MAMKHHIEWWNQFTPFTANSSAQIGGYWNKSAIDTSTMRGISPGHLLQQLKSAGPYTTCDPSSSNNCVNGPLHIDALLGVDEATVNALIPTADGGTCTASASVECNGDVTSKSPLARGELAIYSCGAGWAGADKGDNPSNAGSPPLAFGADAGGSGNGRPQSPRCDAPPISGGAPTTIPGVVGWLAASGHRIAIADPASGAFGAASKQALIQNGFTWTDTGAGQNVFPGSACDSAGTACKVRLESGTTQVRGAVTANAGANTQLGLVATSNVFNVSWTSSSLSGTPGKDPNAWTVVDPNAYSDYGDIQLYGIALTGGNPGAAYIWNELLSNVWFVDNTIQGILGSFPAGPGGVPTKLQPGDTYTITEPALIADPARVEEVLNRDGNLEALGITPSTGPSAAQAATAQSAPSTAMTAGAARTMAAWERTYTADSERFHRGRKPENNGQDSYEYIADVDECHNADDSDNEAGWIKNRFSYCQETMTVMPAIKCGLWPLGCYIKGTFISTNTLIGRGKMGSLDGTGYTRFAEFDFNVDVHISTGDFNQVGAQLEARLECEGDWATGVPGNPKKEDACTPGLNLGRKDSPSQWKYNGDTKFDLWSHAPKLPDIAYGDQIATGLFTPVLKFTLPGYSQLIPSKGEQGEVRFDSAAYINRANSGSVFPNATPALRYDRSDTSNPNAPGEPWHGVAAVADHIGDAFANPGNTYPTKSGKKLPGRSAVDPLYRLTQSFGATELQRYDDNQTVRVKACNNAPDKPAQGDPPKDCDEYPFRSSYQGAARYMYEGEPYRDDFTVRHIDPTENQEAGGRLLAWYNNDRILNHDPFIIVIGD
ncbi:hypothetical protein [Streptomyces sp. NPDC096339]|uniref:NucA/NucB deoxyribonuclease domain-containing protein n=1 Tax=Streptomyces sp. NPDC096339 TaxID=3366086 RepID=UPI00381E6B14